MKKVSITIILLAAVLTLVFYPETYVNAYRFTEDCFTALRLSEFRREEIPANTDENKTNIVFMFDDGWETVYSNAYPLFNKYGYKGSIAIIPSMCGEKEYLSFSQIGQLYMEGWDILNHSYSHEEDMYTKCDELLIDFQKARKWMNNRFIGKCAGIAVCPYGYCNPYLIKLLDEAGYDSIRTLDMTIVLNQDKISYFPQTTIGLLPDMEASTIEAKLLSLYGDCKMIIFILHKIEDTPDNFNMTFAPDKLSAILDFIHSNEDRFRVVPYSSIFIN